MREAFPETPYRGFFMAEATLPCPETMDMDVKDSVIACMEEWRGEVGNLIMILHEIQNRHGYVPRPASLLLSDLLEIPLARIYEVLTFYHYFKLVPPGKHDIIVCNGTACYLKGAGRLLGELETRLGIKDGDTTEDRLFHIETVRCIGCCGMSPALIVDGKTVGKLGPSDVAGIIETIRKEEAANETADA